MNVSIFKQGKGPLYLLDPRSKVMLTLYLCVYVFLPVTFASVVGVALFSIGISLYSLGKKNTLTILLSVLPMLIIMLIFSPLYERGGTPLWMCGTTVVLTKEGLLQSLILDFRFLSITFAWSLLFATTKMDEFMLALQAFHLPYKACLTISLVFRSIPDIFDSFNDIIDSHKLRRGTSTKVQKKVRHRLKNLGPTLTSALVVSLRSIPTLAMSLEARGYGLKTKRSQFHSLDSYRHHYLYSLVFFMIFVTLFILFQQ